MAFTRTWDAAYEALPTDANYGYEIDDYIRQCRVDVSERMQIDHVWKTGATDGMHKLSGFQGAQYAADAEASDTYVVTLSPVPSAYFAGMVVNFKANTVNTGAATLNVNGLGAKAIKKNYNVALADGDILAGQIVTVIYDGTNFQLLNTPQNQTYETGTWTPALSFGGATTGITYTYQSGYYTKIGNIVTLSGYVALSSKGSANGTVLLTGLPFTVANNVAGRAAAALRIYGITFSGFPMANTVLNSKTIVFQQCTEAGVGSTLTDANFANDSTFDINITYRVEP